MKAALVALCAWLGAAANAQLVAWPAPPDAPALRIDGRLDEALWSQAPVHEAFWQYLPVDGQRAPAAYRTTVQVIARADALVFGIRAFDPRPAEIRAPLTRRDQVGRDQDFVTVLLDAVGARRGAQFVRVNAAGVIADGVYRAAEDNEDTAPDFDIDAATTQGDDGWTAEIRVPLIELRYPPSGGLPWRVMVARSIPRAASTLLVSAPLTKEALNFLAELQPLGGADAVAERAREGSLLALRPELTLRARRERDATGAEATERRTSLGLEAKWRPRADWVFDATLNPDFSQVELDVPQLAGNTRFALSVPEKRPFFLESTDVIDLPIGAFYSRSITDPAWGLRGTWRAAGADATAFTLRDEGGGLILRPGPFATRFVAQDARSQATFARGRWRGDGSTVGALLSWRDAADGSRNAVAGADWRWHPGDARALNLRALVSRTEDAGAAPESGHHLHAHWRARIPGWNFDVKATQISPRFRNDNGFVDQAGVRVFETEILRRYGETQLPGFTAHEFELFVWALHKTTMSDAAAGIEGGRTVQRLLHPGSWLIADRNTEAWVQWRADAERARPGGMLHDTPALAFGGSANPWPWLTKVGGEASVGRLLDVEADRTGRGAYWEAYATVRVSALGLGFESEQAIEQVFIDGPDGRRAFTDSAARWLGVVHWTSRDALRLVWQRGRYLRREDASVGLAASNDERRTTSVVYQRKFGTGRSVSVGASRQRLQPDGVRRDEVFAKAAWAI